MGVKVKKRVKVFYDIERDGITFSLLSGWLACRERARLNLSGWTETATTLPLVFGDIMHGILEHAYTDAPALGTLLADAEERWIAANPRASADATQYMTMTLAIAEALVPAYFAYWHEDKARTWVRLEQEFKIPITLMVEGSAVRTFIRGKMDGVFRSDPFAPPTLLETKTKTFINEDTLSDILKYELQVHVYMNAIRRLYKETPTGVLYNVIRRPGLRQKVSESDDAYVQRIAEDVAARPEWYFMRFESETTDVELDAAWTEIMAAATDFARWHLTGLGHYRNSNACETKYGTCPMLSICARNDFTRFHKRDTVFRELGEL